MSFYDFFDASNLAALQADFNPMVVNRGFSQDVFHNTFRECSVSLIFL